MTRPFRESELRRLLTDRSGDFVLLESSRTTGGNRRSLLFTRPRRVLRCRLQDWRDFLPRCQEALDQGGYLAGWLSYEYGLLLEPKLRPLLRAEGDPLLAEMGVFDRPAIFTHETGRWDREPKSGSADAEQIRPVAIENIAWSETREHYVERILRIKDYIVAGDTYQVNYTLKLRFDLVGEAADLYLQLRAGQGVGYGAFLSFADRRILSFSPELFFSKRGDRLEVRPMKGTLRRGRTAAEDAALADFLRSDEKNLSENVMIVDLLRNDLGRLAGPGQVSVPSLFDVETYESLHQMTSTVVAQLPGTVSLEALFGALFPCGSVTGAPKIRTMEIIDELEGAPRGVYTGAIGYLAPEGDACFNVPIRTVVLSDGRGEMGVGSGIVADSDPDGEWQECRLKARFLTHSERFDLIETLLWRPGGGFWLLPDHLERLAASAHHFNFVYDEAKLISLLGRIDAALPQSAQRVRVALDREGGLALDFAACAPPVCTSLRGVVRPEASCALETAACGLADASVDSDDLFFYHKTSRRRLYDRARRRAAKRGCLDLLFCNERGEVTEGSITNVFIRRGETFLTPPISCGLLPGVLRGHLLQHEGDLLREAVLTIADLRGADAIYLGNSVRGLVPVHLID